MASDNTMDAVTAGSIYVYDRRSADGKDITITRVQSFQSFRDLVVKELSLEDPFVLTTTHRDPVTAELYESIEDGDTLYILNDTKQELESQAKERVSYLPHYDTIVKGGMYEYYASEGQNPLPYAFAELIDNALAATAENVGPRNIEIRLHLDENMVLVLDNGRGMTSRQLNNWAIYRLSKFIRNRRDRLGDGEQDHPVPSILPNAPRSLNSDISYFGVGGKQAIFFIGSSTRMISRARESPDVHELTISKEEFEAKEKNRESIYSGFIRNRKTADSSHLSEEDITLKGIIEEESDKESFTAVVINGINPSHTPYLKGCVRGWTRQLAHIYHYYLHGPNGNVDRQQQLNCSPIKNIEIMPDEWFTKINIEVKLYDKRQRIQVINLRDVCDDMQTQYIRTAASSFEFKATVEGTGIVEGVLRYHPFLFDRETYPSDANDHRAEADPEDDHDYTTSDVRPARGRRPIYECYWNGRLIPYTSIAEFDWCAVPKKPKLPPDCYNRISGVLWTNDKFQVSTNKLTFIDLEMKLRDKLTAYTRIIGKTDGKKNAPARKLQEYTVLEKRTDIGREFQTWLKECHEHCDKQIKFSEFQGVKTRPELPKTRQGPWGTFDKITWDQKVYKIGSLVRITRTLPILYGSIKKIWLFGDYDGDVYSTGGELEVIQEPRALYDDVKFVPLTKLDRLANEDVVKRYIEEEEGKLPDQLNVTWPSGMEVVNGEKRAAGKTIGDMRVEIVNRKQESISKLPGAHQQRKLLVELKVIWHSPHGDVIPIHHISQHGKSWPYWFRKMENVKNLGSYTLQLQCVLNESGASTFAGKDLPSYRIRFSVTEAEPEKFSVGMLEGPFRIGVPFNIPLEFQDEFGHLTKPSGSLTPKLEASGLELSYKSVEVVGNSLLIKTIVALGSVPSNGGKSFSLVVTVDGLGEDSQTLKIRMLPGPPHTLVVRPESVQIENGGFLDLSVEVRDEAGNITAYPKAVASVHVAGVPGVPHPLSVDCSRTGQGVLTGSPLTLSKVEEETMVTAKVDLPQYRAVAAVEVPIKVLPSSRVSLIEVSYQKDGESCVIQQGQDIQGVAGECIKSIVFQLRDEAGREKVLDEDFASKLKVNWTPKLSRDSVLKGKLPDIKAPNSVAEAKYCHITVVDGSGIDFTFSVKAVPGPPAQMKCTLNGSNQVRLGEVMTSDILVGIRDKHGNEIKKFEKGVLKDLVITGEGLVFDDTIRALGQTSGFNIHGVKFDSGTLGSRELKVSWQELTDYVRADVMAGPPDKLTLPGWDLSQPLTVYNDTRIKQNLTVQLCDKAGNPTAEENIKVQLAREQGLKMTPLPQPIRTNKAGQAPYGVFTVSGKRGVYELQPKAFIGRTIISGPKLKISIQPDPTKPVSLRVEPPGVIVCRAGEGLPDFTVSVVSEEETEMTSAKVSALRLKILDSSDSSRLYQHPADPRNKSDPGGVFTFSKRKAPEKSGGYSIVVYYVDGKHSISSEAISLTVEPGPPEKLVSIDNLGTPTASNTKNESSRTLIKRMLLELRDKFNNRTGENVTGKVKVEVSHRESLSDKSAGELPNLVGNTHSVQVSLTRGQAHVQDLKLQENTPGRDSQEYLLRCTVEGAIAKDRNIPALEIPFLFFNDVKKQSQMAALSRERDNLRSTIAAYKSLFDTTQQLVDELKLSLQEAREEEMKVKDELTRSGFPRNLLSGNAQQIDDHIARLSDEKATLKNTPRRMCGLQPAVKHTEVLGKIAQLALVEEDAIARVLSWHMSADMDCVVTLTTARAKDIHRQSQGKQQVLPLDSIYRKNLPDWKKPLPHMRLRPNWKPNGNPMYARDLLIFPAEEEHCKIVFGMLLGDTIILDTLDDANAYRGEIVRFTHCPTILTREGDRIRSNGKFGGLMNRALPVEKLRGAVFGAPINANYYKLSDQIDLLSTLKAAVVKRQGGERDLREQQDGLQTAEMRDKLRECQESEEQLKDIEDRLKSVRNQPSSTVKPPSGGSGSALASLGTPPPPPPPPATVSNHSTPTGGATAPTTPTSGGGRRRRTSVPKLALSPEEPTPTPPKKSRTSTGSTSSGAATPTAAVNGNSEGSGGTPSSTPSSTPTRTSARRAAQGSSVAWESLRKRTRRN